MKIATGLTRVLLLLYPASFRREMGAALIADVRRRAQEKNPLWLVRLGASLIVNAVGAWAETTNAGPDHLRQGYGGPPKLHAKAEGPAYDLKRHASTARRASLFSWLDLKLAFRMLGKYPGLTIVGGLGIAVAIAIGVGFFALFYARFYPAIPLPDGDRLVGLENWDRRTHREDRRSLSDFVLWRSEMTTVEDMTAFRTVGENVVTDDGSVDVAEIAEITPSGFQLARVPPLLGRSLVDTDAAPDADPVLVIGFDVWRTRFASDPNIVGQHVRVGRTVHSIVGVMPDGFAFPVKHQYWTPLKGAGPEGPASELRGRGPSIFIAARLAPGFDLDDANAELARIGERSAAAFPDTHRYFRPEVVPYSYPFAGMSRSSAEAFWPGSVLLGLLLAVICVNVAILIYARTATRLGEIAVRSALGASRGRIVAQLFAESFVLSAAAAGVGLLVVKFALDWASSSVAGLGQSTFWESYALPRTAFVYFAVLTVLAAVITGVVPALRATGRRVNWNLHQFQTAHGLRMGRTWTTLIVVQVGLASAALPIAVALGWFQVRDIFSVPNFPVEQILFAELSVDRQTTPTERFAWMQQELSDRLDAEPGVAGHAFTFDLPTMGRAWRIAVEGENAAAAPAPGTKRSVERATIDRNFLHTFDLDVLAGRSFNAADFGEGAADAILVNRAFASRVLGGGEALGRRIRYVANEDTEDTSKSQPERWYQIVGVVENIEENPFGPELVDPRVFHPMTHLSADVSRLRLAVRVAGIDQQALATRLRKIAVAIDPTLQCQIVPLQEAYRLQRVALSTAAIGIGVALLSVILLAAAGIYALMSFTVSQRRREIAIRTALGAQPTRLMSGIFRRALRQIATGVVTGVAIAVLLNWSQDGEALQGRAVMLLSSTVLLMTVVGFLAVIGPARRGLRIEPVEALKSE